MIRAIEHLRIDSASRFVVALLVMVCLVAAPPASVFGAEWAGGEDVNVEECLSARLPVRGVVARDASPVRRIRTTLIPEVRGPSPVFPPSRHLPRAPGGFVTPLRV